MNNKKIKVKKKYKKEHRMPYWDEETKNLEIPMGNYGEYINVW
jgi:hypothetical protein